MKLNIRKSNMELLRIISMFLIVVFHISLKGGFSFGHDISINKFIVKTFWMFGELGVNLFVLISGYFMINSNFKIKKLVLLMLQVLFYSIITVAFATLIGIYKVDSLLKALLVFFPIILRRYWFVTAYVIIYILSPYINLFAKSLSKVMFRKLLLLLLFLYCVIPTLFGAFLNNTESFLFYNRFIWLIIVYLLGAYIKMYGIKKINTKRKSSVLAIMSFLFLISSILVIDKFETLFRMIGIKEIAYFWTPNNIPMVLLSLSIFVLFTQLDIKCNKVINKIASTTLGVYLLHDGVLASWIWSSFFKVSSYQKSSFLIFYILFFALIVFLIGMLIDFIRQLFEKFIVKKIIELGYIKEKYVKFRKKINIFLGLEMKEMINKMLENRIVRYALISLFSISFAFISFYLLVHYKNVAIIITVLTSLVASFIFVKLTFDDMLSYVKNNKIKTLVILLLSIIVVFAMHKSKGIPRKNLLVLSLPIKFFRLRWWLLTIPAICYIFIWLYKKIVLFLKNFFGEMSKREKKIYLYATIISSVVVLVSYVLCDKWFHQFDLVYSLDSGYVNGMIYQRISYYDIRHPVISLITFPIWAISNFILKLFVPSQLLTSITSAFLQIINIQLILLIAFMIKKLSKNNWVLWLYLASAPTLLFTMFLEKYQLCTFLLVLYVYLHCKDKKNKETNLILATGTMATSAFIYAHILFEKDKLLNKLKSLGLLILKGLTIVICFGRTHLLHPKFLLEELTYMSQRYGLHDLPIDKCINSFTNFIQGTFVGLSSTVGERYRWINIVDKLSFIGIIIFILLVIGVVINRKDKFTRICAVWIFISMLLFLVFQWGIGESPLFCLYFSWALIPLFQNGLQFLITKFKWNEKIVYLSIIIPMLIVNILNIIDVAMFFS